MYVQPAGTRSIGGKKKQRASGAPELIYFSGSGKDYRAYVPIMSPKCSHCHVIVKENEIKIACTSCRKVFHGRCKRLTMKECQKQEKIWKCEKCLEEAESEAEEEESEIEGNMISLMKKNFKTLRAEMKELEKSQEFFNSQYEEMNIKLDEIVLLTKKVTELENKMVEKDSVIADLSFRLNKLEQYTRKDSFEMREVAQIPGESVKELVVKVVRKMNIALDEKDILAAHRLPVKKDKTAKKAKIAPILVKLARNKRDEILATKEIVHNKDITGQDKLGRIYIGESLSPYYRNLLWQTKSLAKTKGYKYVWFRKNAVLVRKEDGSAIVNIQTTNDFKLL